MDDLQNGLVKTEQDSPQWIPVNVQYTTEGNVQCMLGSKVNDVCLV